MANVPKANVPLTIIPRYTSHDIHMSHDTTWENKNAISPLPQQYLWASNLLQWWLSLRGSNILRQMCLSLRDHLITRDKITVIYPLQTTCKHKTWYSSNLIWRVSKENVLNYLLKQMSLWVCSHVIPHYKIKTLCLHFRNTCKYQTWPSGH